MALASLACFPDVSLSKVAFRFGDSLASLLEILSMDSFRCGKERVESEEILLFEIRTLDR